MTASLPTMPVDAYLSTTIEVHMPNPIRVAGPGAVLWLPFSPMTVITACNPFSQPTDDATNAQANADLSALLLGMGADVLPAVGTATDASWPAEPSFAVRCTPLQILLALGRAFRQHAIFVLTDEVLTVVSCSTGRAVGSRRR